MSSDSLGGLIHRISGVYRDPHRVLRDAEFLLSSPSGSHLRPTTESMTHNDGSSTPPVLLLRGTIPMTYRAVTYNLPIDMYLPPPYPLRPPTVFIRPVASMAIKENHRHVGLDGKVYLPYLHDWRPGTHDLRELAVWMSSLFGSEPPCYARPASAASPAPAAGGPPPYSQAAASSSSAGSAYGSVSSAASALRAAGGAVLTDNDWVRAYQVRQADAASSSAGSASSAASASNNAAAAEEDERRRVVEREVAEANLAVEAARRASAEEARAEAEQKRMQENRDRKLSSQRAMATTKVQFEIRTLFDGAKEELRLELKNQKQLDHGKERIVRLTKEGKARRGQLEKGNEELDDAIEGLEKWLKAVGEERSAAEGGAGDDEDGGARKADLVALPADVHSAQMLALSAENAALDDCMDCLDRALALGSVTVEVFLKEVRKLSQRQFMAKAHLIKIAQIRAAEQR